MDAVHCEMPACSLPSQAIEKILLNSKRIAVVGLSPKPHRESHKVARYLQERGYEIVPVNPGQKRILGRTCYGTLEEIPFKVDVANLFLNPNRIPPVVDQCIRMGVNTIWMQLGIVHNEAGAKARAAGIAVVMNRCIMEEHRKLRRAEE